MPRAIAAHLLEGFEDFAAAVHADDSLVAARAMLALLDQLPWSTPSVPLRSAWLACLRDTVAALGDDCPHDVEVGMLLAVAATALAARQTGAGLAAAEQALRLAVAQGDEASAMHARALRLPWLIHRDPVLVRDDAAKLDAALAAGPARFGPWAFARLLLAKLAMHVALPDPAGLRTHLAQLARLQLGSRPALESVALASQGALVQLGVQTHQPVLCQGAVREALRLCEAGQAYAEQANWLVLDAALAVQGGEFERARSGARSALVAARKAGLRHAGPDPWLGLPFDLSVAPSAAQAVEAIAEAVLVAQDRGDSRGFVLSVAAMTALYLADDRIHEAVDALGEARQTAAAWGHADAEAATARMASALLAHLGVLRTR